MTTFQIHISTDNAAFEDDSEIPRILRKIADDIDNGRDISMFQTILDANGNNVGRYGLEDNS